MMMRIAVLVDLPREASSGGHVKYWERIAQAAHGQDGLDLTVYFSGATGGEILSPRVRYRYLPPAFSSANLKFLPYVPAHTDLAPFHAGLAQELGDYDLVHATDGYFAFARTAEYITRWTGLPWTTSFHTATPAYAELFARKTLESLFGRWWGAVLTHARIPKRARRNKEKRLKKHLRQCDTVLVMRPEDVSFAEKVVGRTRIARMRQGVDKRLFSPDHAARASLLRDHAVEADRFLVLFVGRVDAGKNVPLLIDACARAIASGARLQLIVAGLGPLKQEVKDRLGEHATLVGHVEPEALARLYASVDCLAIASDIEIGGMIALEALASGCPVLVSRKSGIAQLCGETPAMRTVESDAEAWAATLTDLARDPAAQARMRDAALAYRQQRLPGWDDILREDFVPVWRRAIEGRKTDVR